MTPQGYVNSMMGKAVDMDGFAGVQCWDLWAHFCTKVGSPIIYCGGDGYVYNLWTNRNSNGVKGSFKIITKNFRVGDWLIFGKGGDTPYSHVAMLIGGGGGSVTVFGQNQGGTGAASAVTISTSSLLGGFRLKAWAHSNFGKVNISGGGGSAGGDDEPEFENRLFLSCQNGIVTAADVKQVEVVPSVVAEKMGIPLTFENKQTNEFLISKFAIEYLSLEEIKKRQKIIWNSHTWTWYSHKILDYNIMQISGIHKDSQGVFRDKDNLICLLGGNNFQIGDIILTPNKDKGRIYFNNLKANYLAYYTDW